MNIDTKHLRELEVVTRSASAPDAKWLASNNRKLLYSPRGFTVDCSFAPDAAFVLAAVNNLVPLCDEVDSLRAQLAEAKAILATWSEWGGHCPTCAFVRHRDANPFLSPSVLKDYCDCGWDRANALLAQDGAS